MLALVIGGSGSGKSAWAEELAAKLAEGPLYYVATMISCDGECDTRIARHRQQREGKGFETVEQSVDIGQWTPDPDGTVLLECLSTLLTNELYREHPAEAPEQKIWDDLQQMMQCTNVIVVSNDVFGDGTEYDPETMQYIEKLGWLHRKLAAQADLVAEIVVGLPLIRKGELL